MTLTQFANLGYVRKLVVQSLDDTITLASADSAALSHAARVATLTGLEVTLGPKLDAQTFTILVHSH